LRCRDCKWIATLIVPLAFRTQADIEFGEQLVTSIELLRMKGAEDDSGYYECEVTVPFLGH
jgi:hypothetical protein